MRYTLRLLTAQQFQRAAALVCAAELRPPATTTPTLGQRRRSGSGCGWAAAVSPKRYTEAAGAGQRAAPRTGTGRRADRAADPALPLVRHALDRHRTLRRRRRATRSVFRLLRRPRGEDAARSPRDGAAGRGPADPHRRRGDLPATPPALVIATVDKFAQLPWRGRRRRAVRPRPRALPAARLPAPDDLDATTGCTGRSTTRRAAWPAVTSPAGGRLRPPDLIIQDELHLITGALGHHGRPVRDRPSTSCASGPARRQAGPARRSSPPPRPSETGRASRCAACSAASWRSSRRRSSTSATPSSPPRCRSPPDNPGPALPRGLRARGPAQVGRDPGRRDPAARRADCCSTVTARAADPYMTLGRLLQRHPRAGRHAPLPRRRRHHPGRAGTATRQGPVRPAHRHPAADDRASSPPASPRPTSARR